MKEYWTTFTGAGGYPGEIEQAMKIFEVGKRYRITGGEMGQSRTYIDIKGFNGVWNSCLFDVDIDNVPIIGSDY